MKQNQIETIISLFEGKEIRSIWDSEKEDYYFSVVDVIYALTESSRPSKYWTDLKNKLISEGSELSEKIGKLKMKDKTGRNYPTEVLDTEGIFRLIESIPSKNAEPLKMWLARLGKERVEEVFDPEKALDRVIDYYRKKGYQDDWIEKRMKGRLDRKKLTDTWEDLGINTPKEYAILTNEIYKSWSGMTAKDYKKYKSIRKESPRDNMTDLEILLTDIGEITTRELALAHKPQGFEENKIIANQGGEIANNTRIDIESKLNKPVITSSNNLSYQYQQDNAQIENK
jgi:hypothetical protein